MKVKLKEGEKLSSNRNFCNLNMDDWTALNQGKQVDLKTIPDIIKDKILSNSYEENIKFIVGLDEIEYHEGFHICPMVYILVTFL